MPARKENMRVYSVRLPSKQRRWPDLHTGRATVAGWGRTCKAARRDSPHLKGQAWARTRGLTTAVTRPRL